MNVQTDPRRKEDPEKGESGQLTWTRLPQGFKNAPTLFDEALNQDLRDFREQHKTTTLLQYVDDPPPSYRDLGRVFNSFQGTVSDPR